MTPMRRPWIAFVALAIALTVSCLPAPARANKLERPKITLTKKGNDLEIVVHNVTDYCAHADTRIVRTGDSIRILRERPSKSSRCLETSDLTFIAPNVEAGRYTITYERLPLIAPLRWIQVASMTAIVE
jgi:hypothetical protein